MFELKRGTYLDKSGVEQPYWENAEEILAELVLLLRKYYPKEVADLRDKANLCKVIADDIAKNAPATVGNWFNYFEKKEKGELIPEKHNKLYPSIPPGENIVAWLNEYFPDRQPSGKSLISALAEAQT